MSSIPHYSIHNPPTEITETSYEGVTTSHPFEWNGKTEQSLLVQGIVVSVGETALQLAITHIHDGNWRSDSMYGEVGHTPWFQQIGTLHYRELFYLSERKANKDILENLERRTQPYTIHEGTPFVEPGDTVHVHRTIFWQDVQNGLTGLHITDICKLPVPNMNVDEALVKLYERNIRLAKQLARTAQYREHLNMISNPRIQPNQAFRPFAETVSSEERTVNDRRVFGHAQVLDHFVDVSATKQYEGNREVQGDMRFTEKGDATVVRNIMPFGEGSDNDPLMELSIKIHSDTVLNKAVGEQQVYVVVDGVKYAAFKDPEASSHYFEQLGHDVIFSGFRAEGETLDCFWLTAEQKDAYFRKSAREREISMQVLNEAIMAGKDYYGSDAAEVNAEIARKLAEAEELAVDDAKIIESIKSSPLDGSISSGAPLMIPRSMLDSIEVVFPNTD